MSGTKRKRRRRQTNCIRLKLGAASIEVNGRSSVRSVDYELVEFDDGTYRETGLPPGLPTRPTMGQLGAWAFGRDDKEQR